MSPSSTTLSRKALARIAFGVAPLVAVVGLSAGPASAAKPRQGTTPASCDIDNSDGTTGQAPEGTRIGLFYCGSDGEWHFGTVVLDWSQVSVDPVSPTGPIMGTTLGTKGVVAGARIQGAVR